MKRLRGLAAQLLLFTILPLFLVVSVIALGSVFVHQRTMRIMVGERDLRAALTAAAGLSGQPLSSAGDLPPTARQVLSALQANPETVVMLVNEDETAVYHTMPGQVGQRAVHAGVREALTGDSGILYVSDTPGGPEHVVAYTPVLVVDAEGRPSRWALVLEEPWGLVASPWLRISLIAPLLLLPAAALASAALWLGVRRIVQPLQRLHGEVVALAQGDFQAANAPVGGIEEIVELQDAVAQMAAQIQDYQQSIRSYLDATTTAQEEERKRLARELHDETVQDLIALKQRIQSTRRMAARDVGALDGQLADLQAMVDAAIDEVRRLTRALRPIYLEEVGLVAALEALARDTRRSDLEVAFEAAGEPRRLPAETELTLYRIVQEALNNVLKHAQASHASVRIDFAGQGVTVRVRDDGVGFQVPERSNELVGAGHYGLIGMQERARLIGARLAIHSRPGEGMTVEVHSR